jgi:hypothetical protein
MYSLVSVIDLNINESAVSFTLEMGPIRVVEYFPLKMIFHRYPFIYRAPMFGNRKSRISNIKIQCKNVNNFLNKLVNGQTGANRPGNLFVVTVEIPKI